MGSIYRRCSRVVVWLGDDMVSTAATRHRARHGLHEISHKIRGGGIMEKILRRWYFRRV